MKKDVITSKDLAEQMNSERKREGKYSMPSINSGQANTGNYARMDKSWSSSIDFFIKLIRRDDKK